MVSEGTHITLTPKEKQYEVKVNQFLGNHTELTKQSFKEIRIA